MTTGNELQDHRFKHFCDALQRHILPSPLRFWIVTGCDIDEETKSKVESMIRGENADSRKDVNRQISSFELRFFSCGLTKEEDIYVRHEDQRTFPRSKLPRLGYSSGPNCMFYKMYFHLASLKEEVGSFLLLETDCTFHRQNWFQELDNLCKKETFWILGSTYKGNAEIPYFLFQHLNGVAVYNVNNPSFVSFMRHVLFPFHTESILLLPWLSYDCAIDCFVKSLLHCSVPPISSKENLQLRLLQSMMINTNLIINVSTSVDDELSNDLLLDWFPNKVIVHQKS